MHPTLSDGAHALQQTVHYQGTTQIVLLLQMPFSKTVAVVLLFQVRDRTPALALLLGSAHHSTAGKQQ